MYGVTYKGFVGLPPYLKSMGKAQRHKASASRYFIAVVEEGSFTIASKRRLHTLGSRSLGLRMKLLPAAIAIGNIQHGTIHEKLNGMMPATTPSG